MVSGVEDGVTGFSLGLSADPVIGNPGVLDEEKGWLQEEIRIRIWWDGRDRGRGVGRFSPG